MSSSDKTPDKPPPPPPQYEEYGNQWDILQQIDVFLENDSPVDAEIPENTKKNELDDSVSLHKTVITQPVMNKRPSTQEEGVEYVSSNQAVFHLLDENESYGLYEHNPNKNNWDVFYKPLSPGKANYSIKQEPGTENIDDAMTNNKSKNNLSLKSDQYINKVKQHIKLEPPEMNESSQGNPIVDHQPCETIPFDYSSRNNISSKNNELENFSFRFNNNLNNTVVKLQPRQNVSFGKDSSTRRNISSKDNKLDINKFNSTTVEHQSKEQFLFGKGLSPRRNISSANNKPENFSYNLSNNFVSTVVEDEYESHKNVSTGFSTRNFQSTCNKNFNDIDNMSVMSDCSELSTFELPDIYREPSMTPVRKGRNQKNIHSKNVYTNIFSTANLISKDVTKSKGDLNNFKEYSIGPIQKSVPNFERTFTEHPRHTDNKSSNLSNSNKEIDKKSNSSYDHKKTKNFQSSNENLLIPKANSEHSLEPQPTFSSINQTKNTATVTEKWESHKDWNSQYHRNSYQRNREESRMSYENKSRNFSNNNPWNNSSIPPKNFYNSKFTPNNWSRDQNFKSKRGGYFNNFKQTPNTVRGNYQRQQFPRNKNELKNLSQNSYEDHNFKRPSPYVRPPKKKRTQTYELPSVPSNDFHGDHDSKRPKPYLKPFEQNKTKIYDKFKKYNVNSTSCDQQKNYFPASTDLPEQSPSVPSNDFHGDHDFKRPKPHLKPFEQNRTKMYDKFKEYNKVNSTSCDQRINYFPASIDLPEQQLPSVPSNDFRGNNDFKIPKPYIKPFEQNKTKMHDKFEEYNKVNPTSNEKNKNVFHSSTNLPVLSSLKPKEQKTHEEFNRMNSTSHKEKQNPHWDSNDLPVLSSFKPSSYNEYKNTVNSEFFEKPQNYFRDSTDVPALSSIQSDNFHFNHTNSNIKTYDVDDRQSRRNTFENSLNPYSHNKTIGPAQNNDTFLMKDNIKNKTNSKTVEPYNNCSINETRPSQSNPNHHNKHDDKTNKPIENYFANETGSVTIKPHYIIKNYLSPLSLVGCTVKFASRKMANTGVREELIQAFKTHGSIENSWWTPDDMFFITYRSRDNAQYVYSAYPKNTSSSY